MATSGSTNYTHTRDSIITRALRICTAIGQGETPTATEISEAAIALNDLIKRFQADGMELWERYNLSVTTTASTATYAVGVGQTVNNTAPLKIYDAYYRNTSTSTDTPMNLITGRDYDRLGNKASTGTPNMVFYTPPGASIGELTGTITLYPTPDTTFAAGNIVHLICQLPIQDVDAAGDNLDFPSFYYNALVWSLAAQLSYEYGVPLSERAMIDKKAEYEHALAMSFDVEEGSLYIQPNWQYRHG